MCSDERLVLHRIFGDEMKVFRKVWVKGGIISVEMCSHE